MLLYDCNKSCSFCFAKAQEKKFKKPMSLDNFKKLLFWLEELAFFQDPNQRNISILGGEPSLHSDFEKIIQLLKENNVRATVFSNGTFSHEKLKYFDKDVVTGFVVNYNPKKHYTEKEYDNLDKNTGFNVKLSYNITKVNLDYKYIFDACKKYKINDVRFAVCSPTTKFDNTFLNLKEIKNSGKNIINFVKEGVKNNIKLDLDCSIPLCMFNEKDVFFFQKHVNMPANICKSAIDVNPDLSVYYCLPLSNIKVKKLTEFDNLREINEYFDTQTNDHRNRHSFLECKTCKYWISKICQGGCLALKKKYGLKKKKEKAFVKIGIETWGGIGDGLLVTPSISALKHKYPNSEINIVCNKDQEQIFENNLNISSLSVNPDNSAFEGYKKSKIFNTNYGKLEPSINYKKHASEIIADLLHVKLKNKKLDVFLTKEDENFAKKKLLKYTNPIIIHISSRCSKNQEWPLERWEELVKQLPEFTFIQIGLTKTDSKVKGTVDLRNTTTIQEAIALIKYSKLFLGVDSVFAHAANAVNIKGIVLFGPSNPEIWGHDNNMNIYKNVNCAPCIDIIEGQACPHEKKCMTKISVKEVVELVNSSIKTIKSKNKKRKDHGRPD